MDIFLTEDGRTYVTVDLKETKDKAKTLANKHFHVNKDKLAVSYAWVKKDTLYFEELKSGKKVWLIWRKTVSEK